MVNSISLSAISFDPELELLWVAEQYGMLSSYTLKSQSDPQTWATYSCFSAASSPPRHIGFLGSGANTIVSVADRDTIRCFKRGGFSLMMLPVPEGTQQFINQFNVSQEENTFYFSGSRGLTQMTLGEAWSHECRSVGYENMAIENIAVCGSKVVTGCSSGAVVVRDSKDLSVVSQLTPMRNPVRATAMFNHTLMVAYNDRSSSSSSSSGASVVKIFDLRKGGEVLHSVELPTPNVLSIKPYTDNFGPATNHAVVLTPQNFYMLHLDAEGGPTFTQGTLPDGEGTCAAVSPSNTCVAVGGDCGYFYTYGHPLTGTDFIMANYDQPPQPQHPSYTQSWAELSTATGFDETVPESSLASSWPEPHYMILTAPQKLYCIDKESNSVVHNQWALHRSESYLPDRKDHLASRIPNPYPFNAQLGEDPIRGHQILLELRREQKRRMTKQSGRGGAGSAGGNDDYAAMEPANFFYSSQHKDVWREWNEQPTKVVGLDNSYPESWVSSLLQSLFLCQPPEFPIRKVILRHLCSRQYCVTCEISFIFSNMLMTAASHQGSNKESMLAPIVPIAHLLRTMAQFPAFEKVFERPRSRDDAVAKIHDCQRAILKMLHKDLQDQSAYPFMNYTPPSEEYGESIANYFGTVFEASSAHKIEPRFYWEVPGSALKVDEGLQHLLKEIERSQEKVQIKRLPPIIVLLLNPEHSHLKPPFSLKISKNNGDEFNYLLNSIVIHLADDVEDVGNFVSFQRIKDDVFSLVNDYRVTHPKLIRELEQMVPALRPYTAVVSYYALSQLTAPSYARNEENAPTNMFQTLGPLLINDIFAAPLQRDRSQQFKSPLKSHLDIKSGVLVAIDAEYVVLKWAKRYEESDHAFPTSSSTKKHMALARVSCIMSAEPGDEVTIMDDYVNTPEEIEDYVTQFSGIRAGDLDALKSTKSLTALKATYLKLRALVDAGVIFVGHGLAQDFRVCNIVVPKNQIIDTLLLFHKPGSRYISLRFLAFHLLGEKVQEVEHDSIEDARTSLRLYRAYQQLKEEGKFEKTLDELLEKGVDSNWYIPSTKSTTGGGVGAHGGGGGDPSVSLTAAESQNLSLNSPMTS